MWILTHKTHNQLALLKSESRKMFLIVHKTKIYTYQTNGERFGFPFCFHSVKTDDFLVDRKERVGSKYV